MAWRNYLVIPEIKALYDVYHSDLEKESYKDVFADLDNLDQIVAENCDIVLDAREGSLKSFPVKALNSLYKIYDAIPSISDYDGHLKIFVAFMLKFHEDAYLVNDNDDKFSLLKNDGYKIFDY
jgi:hypothetical protein